MHAARSHYEVRSGKLDRQARQKIGRELRAMFDNFRESELPERLRDLLNQLDTLLAKDRGGRQGLE